MVLGGCADHRRATDIDILDRRRIVAAGGAHFLERVEVDDRKIDALDAVFLHRGDMVRIVADRQQAAMHRRMQRLHPAVHDFRETGDFRDVGDRKAGRGNRLVRAAGRQELYALLGERLGKLDNAGLVGNRKQRGADPDAVGSGDFLGNDCHRSLLETRRGAGRRGKIAAR